MIFSYICQSLITAILHIGISAGTIQCFDRQHLDQIKRTAPTGEQSPEQFVPAGLIGGVVLDKFFENIDHILTAAAAHFNSNQLNMGIEPLRVQLNGFIKVFAGLFKILAEAAPAFPGNGIAPAASPAFPRPGNGGSALDHLPEPRVDFIGIRF